MRAIYPTRPPVRRPIVSYAAPRVHRSVLQLHDVDRGLVMECRYLADLEQLQVQVKCLRRRPGRAPAELHGVATFQGQLRGHRFQRIEQREYLSLGQAVIELSVQDADALRAWLQLEVKTGSAHR